MPRPDVPEPIPTQPPAVSPVLANLPRRGVPSVGVMVSTAAGRGGTATRIAPAVITLANTPA